MNFRGIFEIHTPSEDFAFFRIYIYIQKSWIILLCSYLFSYIKVYNLSHSDHIGQPQSVPIYLSIYLSITNLQYVCNHNQ